MPWRVEKEAVTNENPVVDSVFIDPERCADELPGNYKFNKIRGDLSLPLWALKQEFQSSQVKALLRLAHDWCMSILRKIPQDETLDQPTPLRWWKGCMKVRSFDFSSATDRFPL
jgi:hypothetical protein